MLNISGVIFLVVILCAAPYTEANNKCSGITCGYGGTCVAGKDKYTCTECRKGYIGGDNKQCTLNLEVKKVDSKLKPVDQGFHIKKPRGGIFAESPSNLFKQIPSDLKKCTVKNCDMCEIKDQSACILCDDTTFLNGKLCVAKCPVSTYATNAPLSGRICAPCAKASLRDCKMQCTTHRWEDNKCIESCVVPSKFGTEYKTGTCQLGKLLAKSASCELKCADHAFKTGSGNLKYTCGGEGIMTPPTSKCQTSWGVYAEREGNQMGELYTSLLLDWAAKSCDETNGFKKLKNGVDGYAAVPEALENLKMPRADFTVSCRQDTNFRRFPKFTLTSKKEYTLLDGTLVIKQPVFYFDNVARKVWQISVRGTGSFKSQDGTAHSCKLMGTYDTSKQAWTLTWLKDKKWSTPFKISFLEITDAAAVAQVSAANVTSLRMSGTCVASLPTQHSQRCVLNLLEKKWLFALNFDPKMSTLQEIVAKYSKFKVDELGLMASLEAHGMMTMYVTDTPQRVGKESFDEGVTVVMSTKFVQGTALMDFGSTLKVQYTAFTTRFTTGMFAKSPAKPALTFRSSSAHQFVKKWKIANFGFIADLEADKFVLKAIGHFRVLFSPNYVALDIGATISKDSIPKKVVASTDRWRSFYGHIGLDLVDVVATCDLTDPTLPVISMVAKLPLGDARVEVKGVANSVLPNKIVLKGAIAKLTLKQLRGYMGDVFNNTQDVVSDASDTIEFTDNKVTLSPLSGHVLLDGQKVYVHRGLRVITKTQLAGSPTSAVISYMSKKPENIGMYVLFPNPTPVALNEIIVNTGLKLRDAVASKFALNLKDSAYRDLIDGLQIKDLKTLSPIPEILTLTPWNIAQNTSMVKFDVEWLGKELTYHLPAPFSMQHGSTFVVDLLSMLKFGCRTSNDCSGSAVCSHAVVGGDYHPLYSTWQCVAKCKQGIEYNLKDAGCFTASQPGETCWGDIACTTEYCPAGTCVERKNIDDPCRPTAPEECDSKYCCTLCGTTCQEYPLKSGFNCTKNDDCKSGWCRETPGLKSCSDLLKKGDACEKNSNCQSNYCSEPQKNKCAVQSKEGGPCFFADECVSGFSCCFECGFTCQVYPRKNGVNCVEDKDCTSKFCHSDTCVSEIPDGGKCSSDKLCSSGYCSEVQGNICVRKGDDGAKCGLDDDCKSAYCAADQGKVCFTPIANGKSCAGDSQCESGFCNNFEKGAVVEDKSKWKCAAKLAAKTECDDDRMCKSGKCDVCSWWVCSCS